MNKTRGQSVLKILNGGVKSLNYPTPPGSKFPISWEGWRCELEGFNPPTPPSNLTLDLNPFDYSIWSVLQEKVYRSRIANVDELKTCLIDKWARFGQSIVDAAIDQ